MKTKAFAVGALLALLALPAQPQQSVTSAVNTRVGGFAQLNVTWDSDENTGDNPSSLRKIAAVPGSIEDGPRTLRWTSSRARLFLDARGPRLWGAGSRAYIEFDFDGAKIGDTGGTSATAAHTPRLRRNYIRLDWTDTWMLLGQHTLLFYDAVGSAAGTFIEGVPSQRGGMTGGSRNRAPQIMAGHRFFAAGGSGLELIGSVGRHATDNQPAEGINDTGTRAAKPALMTMAKFTTPVFGRQALIAGSTYWGEERYRASTATAANRIEKDFRSSGYGLQGALPLGGVMPGIGSFELRASLFKTRNMARWNLGNNSIAPNLGATPSAATLSNAQEIDARGGYGEVNWQITPKYSLVAGTGKSKDDRDDVLAMGGTTLRVWDNKGWWLFGTWMEGPWQALLGFSRVSTIWLTPSTAAETSNASSAVHVVMKYNF